MRRLLIIGLLTVNCLFQLIAMDKGMFSENIDTIKIEVNKIADNYTLEELEQHEELMAEELSLVTNKMNSLAYERMVFLDAREQYYQYQARTCALEKKHSIFIKAIEIKKLIFLR